MADKTVEQPEVEVEVTEKVKDKKVVEDTETPTVEDAVTESEDSKENGDSVEENGKEATNGDSTEGDKCCIKRKSTGAVGEAPEDTPSEGATPEKKAKLDEPAEAESNGEAEVAA